MILTTDRYEPRYSHHDIVYNYYQIWDKFEKCFHSDGYCMCAAIGEEENFEWIIDQCEIMNIEWRLYNSLVYEYCHPNGLVYG